MIRLLLSGPGRRGVFVAAALVLTALALAGCREKEAPASVLRVVATVPPVAGFVERIGGDRVDVTVMVPPGASPHAFEPRPSQMEAVSRAELYVKVGSGIEFELAWMPRLVSLNEAMTVVDASRGVDIIEYDGGQAHEEDGHEGHDDEEGHEEMVHEDHDGHDHDHEGGADPHIWLAPDNAAVMARNIYEALASADPEGRDYYRANLEGFTEELRALDGALSEVLSGLRGRKIMVYHPAWTYLTNEYGIVQVPIEREGKEATPSGIASLIAQARADDVRVIFASPEFSTRSAEVVAREIGGRVVLVSPLEKDYVENMKKVAAAFAEVY